MNKQLSQLKSERTKIAAKLRIAISDNRETSSLKKMLSLANKEIENFKKKHCIEAKTDIEALKQQILSLLKVDSYKVEEKPTDMHEFAFVCSNRGKPQQLKSSTLVNILKECKPYRFDFVVNSIDKHSLIIYFW
jgi:hypothetical protein